MLDMLKETAFLRAFGFFKIPVIFFCSPSVVVATDERVEIKIPLNRRTRNHLGSMYFAVLAVGADVAGGLIAMRTIQKKKLPISLVFKDFKAEFLKRPDGHVHFSCEDGAVVRELVDRAMQSEERQNAIIRVNARVPSSGTDEIYAKLELTLSLKKKK